MKAHANPNDASARRAHPRLYHSAPYECSYLPRETASSLMLDPSQPLNSRLFHKLLNAGFRRSGASMYRPQCRHCNACISVRIAVRDYQPNRAQRRAYKRNADLKSVMQPAAFHPEHFELYCRYQTWRHDGDMVAPTRATGDDPTLYNEYMVNSMVDTMFIEHRLNHRLAAVSVCDLSADGIVAVYSFFAPELKQRSLGTYSIMKLIDYANMLGMDWLYLGYWIRGCKKMQYKAQFQPLFGYMHQQWQPVDLRYLTARRRII